MTAASTASWPEDSAALPLDDEEEEEPEEEEEEPDEVRGEEDGEDGVNDVAPSADVAGQRSVDGMPAPVSATVPVRVAAGATRVTSFLPPQLLLAGHRAAAAAKEERVIRGLDDYGLEEGDGEA